MSVLQTLKEKIVGPSRQRLFHGGFVAWSMSNMERTVTAPRIVPDSRRVEPRVERGKQGVARVSLQVEGDLDLLALRPMGATGNVWRLPGDNYASPYEQLDAQQGWLEGGQIVVELPLPGIPADRGPHHSGQVPPARVPELHRRLDRWEAEVRRWVGWLAQSCTWHNQRVAAAPVQRENDRREVEARKAKEEQQTERLRKQLEAALAGPAPAEPPPAYGGYAH